MRLQSHIWVAGFLRAQQAKGGFAAVARKGAEEAGAVFVIHNRLDGFFSLYGPAPSASFGDDDLSRRFECLHDGVPEPEIAQTLKRQTDFDPDCWIVEIERRCERLELPMAQL